MAEFKKQYARATDALTGIMCSFQPEMTDSECMEFCEIFFAFLFGIYPFAFHTEKQRAAMELAGIRFREPTVYQMVYRFLLRIIPIGKQKKEGKPDNENHRKPNI